MGVVLFLLGYVGLVLAVVVFTLSLACGLYYLSELVEEHTTTAGRVIRLLSWFVALLHLVLLVVDGFPLLQISYSLLTLAVVSTNMLQYPYILVTNPNFLLGSAMTIGNHFMWFNYFSYRPATMLQVATFFALCVWLVPFAYFTSLCSASETLPTTEMTSQSSQKRISLFKDLFNAMSGRPNTTTSPPSDPGFRKQF